jgi:hypothetical protein
MSFLKLRATLLHTSGLFIVVLSVLIEVACPQQFHFRLLCYSVSTITVLTARPVKFALDRCERVASGMGTVLYQGMTQSRLSK